MRILRVIALTWLLTACGAVTGWALGKQFGRQELFLGGIVLGTLAILLAIRLLVRFQWLDPERRRGGSIGGLCAFAIAAPIAAIAMNRDAPPMALLVMALVGLGVIAGAGPSAAR